MGDDIHLYSFALTPKDLKPGNKVSRSETGALTLPYLNPYGSADLNSVFRKKFLIDDEELLVFYLKSENYEMVRLNLELGCEYEHLFHEFPILKEIVFEVHSKNIKG